MKLWAGRFQKETDALVNDFNSSISFDARMYREDITGSIAHAAMLGRQGIIKEHEAEKIIDGLKAILADIEAGQVEFSLENEDIHMNIETILTQRIGDTGKRLHTARSRNDQVAVDFRMYVRKEIQAIIGLILDLEKVLVRKAEANLDTVMPGYTHLQRAQPTTFAHAMMAYANMFKRDVTRLEDCLARMDECPLRIGGPGTSCPVDRFQTAQALGLSKPTDNSLDSVSDRDFALEFLSAISHSDDAPVPVLRGDHSMVLLGIQVRGGWTTPAPPARPSCPRRRTPMWPSCCGARRGGCTAPSSPCSPS